MKVSIVVLGLTLVISAAGCRSAGPVVAGAAGAAVTASAVATRTASTDGGPSPRPTDNRNLMTTTTSPTTREDAVRAFIEMDPGLRRSGVVFTSFGGRVYSGVRVLGASPDGRSLYVVATAMEFTLHDGVVSLASGSSDFPLRFDVTGTGGATRIVGVHTTPNSVHTSPADAHELFPLAVADRYLARQDTEPDRSEAQLLARAQADADAGRLLPS